MILAAPLVIPFAKAVGISVATLGMAKAADMVNDYIQANPEESMKILSTIVPNIGIGQIFMNKEKISLEDLDEMTDEEAQDLTKEEKAELMKQAGKSGGPNKRQTMIDISEKLGLSGEGKEKQDIEYDIDERYDEGGVEEVSKPKFDYKKFFRNRRADGGRIGFNLGGLTGPAKGIYDFMSAAGYFTDDEIRNAITAAGYEIPDASTPTQPEQVTGIINQQITSRNDPMNMNLQKTFTKDFSGDPRFNYLTPQEQALKATFDRSVPTEESRLESLKSDPAFKPREGLLGFFDSAMNKMKESSFFQPKVRGTLGTRLANQKMLPIPVPSMITAQMRSPFNPDSPTYNPLLEGQLNFLEGLDNMIGRDSQSGLLKYGSDSVLSGKNVISGFGTNDYETALMDYITKMTANKRISAAGKAARLAAAEAELEAERERQRQAGQRTTNQGTLDYGITQGISERDYRSIDRTRERSDRQDEGKGPGGSTFDYSDPYDPGGGEKDGGFIDGYNRRKYSDGGLASMFAEKR